MFDTYYSSPENKGYDLDLEKLRMEIITDQTVWTGYREDHRTTHRDNHGELKPHGVDLTEYQHPKTPRCGSSPARPRGKFLFITS
jgi:hypothetical protein